MQSILFSGTVGSLYGCYHAPNGRFENAGVVLANAHGHEYIQFHRVFGQLARMLSEVGFPVLRFDYSGCGDSVGDSEHWSLAQWRSDLGSAVEELRRLAGVSRIGVVGLRLGATIACQNSEFRTSPSFLVLWDAVVNGSAFLREMREAHQSMLRYAHVSHVRDAIYGEELLGFPLPQAWARELDALQLEQWKSAPAPRILLVESNSNASQDELLESLRKVGAVRHLHLSNPHLWAWIEDFTRVHIPIQLLQEIVEEVREAAS
jgi:alpha/beta superfamily hydrolase